MVPPLKHLSYGSSKALGIFSVWLSTFVLFEREDLFMNVKESQMQVSGGRHENEIRYM